MTIRPTIRRLYRAGDFAGLVEAMSDAAFPRRLRIIAFLQLLGTPEAEAALLDALSDRNSLIRSTAVSALGKIDPERDPLPVLQALRGDTSATHEQSPEEVLENGPYMLPSLDTVPSIVRGLSADHHMTRAGSANVLAQLADPRAASALAAAQSDPHKDVRVEARKAYDKTLAASK